MRAALLLCLVSWPALAPADAAYDAINACLYTLRTQPPPQEKARIDIAKSCPELSARLQDSPYGAWLPREWSSELNNPEQLTDLDRLLADSQPVQSAAGPDASAVSSVLKDMHTEAAQREISIWERFVQWLWRRINQQSNEEPPSWLTEWLQKFSMPDGSGQVISRVLFALVIIGALLAIVNELRAAGLFGKKTKRANTIARLEVKRIGNGGFASLAEIEAAALRLQPSLLLDLLLAMLSREQQVAGNRSLTHGELRKVVQIQGEQKTEFEDLVGCAERTRYAGIEPTSEELTGAVAAGRRLVQSVTTRRVAADLS